MNTLGKYSMGIGDRFDKEAPAQLDAIMLADKLGITITPVWNKSNREHSIVHSTPVNTRNAADAAVVLKNFKGCYFVDADHINMSNVDKFIDYSDFFTIDVADYIGLKPVELTKVKKTAQRLKFLTGKIMLKGLDFSIEITEAQLIAIVSKFLPAIDEAEKIYTHIKQLKGDLTFVTEVSMDEVDEAQSPIEMLVILKMIADKGIPINTIAPKFTGRFNKGVDYKGDLHNFEHEFEEDLLAIKYAIKTFGLPEDLKISIHSGSDKFSIYPIVAKLIQKHNIGLHLKTAGTTWLEEVIGLAKSGGKGLEMAKYIYIEAFNRLDELTKPYATVIEINTAELPVPQDLKQWGSDRYVEALQHNPGCKNYNQSFRQLIHVAYKVAAESGQDYLDLLTANKEIVSKCVTENILGRHIKQIFA
jgi:tagaturonate epimerase